MQGILREERILVVGILGDDGGTRRGFRGEDTLNFEVCESVSQLALLRVD